MYHLQIVYLMDELIDLRDKLIVQHQSIWSRMKLLYWDEALEELDGMVLVVGDSLVEQLKSAQHRGLLEIHDPFESTRFLATGLAYTGACLCKRLQIPEEAFFGDFRGQIA